MSKRLGRLSPLKDPDAARPPGGHGRRRDQRHPGDQAGRPGHRHGRGEPGDPGRGRTWCWRTTASTCCPATLAEGRNILRNLRRAGKIFLLKNVYTLLLIIATLGVFRLPFPYLPQQVTLLNKLTIAIPVLVITVSRTSAARAGHAGFLRSIGLFALTTGIATGLAGLAVMLLSARVLGDPELTQRTMLLSTLVLLGLGNLPRVLTAEGERLTWTDRRLLGWPPAAVLLYAAAMYWPLAADFFRLAPLGQLGPAARPSRGAQESDTQSTFGTVARPIPPGPARGARASSVAVRVVKGCLARRGSR